MKKAQEQIRNDRIVTDIWTKGDDIVSSMKFPHLPILSPAQTVVVVSSSPLKQFSPQATFPSSFSQWPISHNLKFNYIKLHLNTPSIQVTRNISLIRFIFTFLLFASPLSDLSPWIYLFSPFLPGKILPINPISPYNTC